MNPYTVEKKGASVLQVTFPGIAAGWQQWFLLSSDRHHDNKMCDRRLEQQHLDLAAEREALICDFGDLFCAMQGKYDPRSDIWQRYARRTLGRIILIGSYSTPPMITHLTG